jgi:hypothetical protein
VYKIPASHSYTECCYRDRVDAWPKLGSCGDLYSSRAQTDTDLHTASRVWGGVGWDGVGWVGMGCCGVGWGGRLECVSRRREIFFSSPPLPDWLCNPSNLLSNEYPGIERWKRKAGPSLPSTAKVRGAIPSLPPHVFMTWWLIEHRNNFALLYFTRSSMFLHSVSCSVQVTDTWHMGCHVSRVAHSFLTGKKQIWHARFTILQGHWRSVTSGIIENVDINPRSSNWSDFCHVPEWPFQPQTTSRNMWNFRESDQGQNFF